MSKKRIDTSERDTSSGQSLGDFLSLAGLNASTDAHKEEAPRPVKTGKPPIQADPLRLRMEKKGRNGKMVTIVSGFTGLTGMIEDLAKTLKTHCGVGGSVKDREIILQGDVRSKLAAKLIDLGYRTKGF